MKNRRVEIEDNGRTTIIFYCQDLNCKESEHGFRIVRLSGIDLDVCVQNLNDGQFISQIADLIREAKDIYPRFVLVEREAEEALLKLAGE